MLFNILGGIILKDFTIIGLGILFTLLFTPFSYLCWFRPAYIAFRSDSSFNFMVFFFIFFFQFVVTTIQAIGIPSSGTMWVFWVPLCYFLIIISISFCLFLFSGIITALHTFGNTAGEIISGIIALIIALGFAFAAAADLFLITKVCFSLLFSVYNYQFLHALISN